MATLKTIAELTWRQLFPPGTDQRSPVTKEEFVATAKSEYAYQFWIKWKQDKANEGEAEVPSFLLSEVNLPVVNNEVDISCLNIMRGLDFDQWLQNIGGVKCSCAYIKSTLNHAQLLCDDDSRPSDYKPYYPIGNKIKFPDGAGTKTISLIYANNGTKVDENVQVDDVLGSLVRRGLLEIYGGKVGAENKVNG